MLLIFTNRRFGRIRILKVDWEVGAMRIWISACPMEDFVLFSSRILCFIPCAATSPSSRSERYLRQSTYSLPSPRRKQTHRSLHLKSKTFSRRQRGTIKAFKQYLKDSR